VFNKSAFLSIDFLDVVFLSVGEFDFITGLDAVSSNVVFNFIITFVVLVRGSEDLNGDFFGLNIIRAVGFVDLEREFNISDNDFSDDDTSVLVQDVSGSQNVTIDLSVDVDLSSRSDDVVNNTSRDGGHVVSSKGNISISENVEDPSVSVDAVLGGVPGNSVDDRGINVNDVSISSDSRAVKD